MSVNVTLKNAKQRLRPNTFSDKKIRRKAEKKANVNAEQLNPSLCLKCGTSAIIIPNQHQYYNC